MISLSVRIHIFLNALDWLDYFSGCLYCLDLYGTQLWLSRALLVLVKHCCKKRQLFSVAFILFFQHLKVCCNITFIRFAPKLAFFFMRLGQSRKRKRPLIRRCHNHSKIILQKHVSFLGIVNTSFPITFHIFQLLCCE